MEEYASLIVDYMLFKNKSMKKVKEEEFIGNHQLGNYLIPSKSRQKLLDYYDIKLRSSIIKEIKKLNYKTILIDERKNVLNLSKR